MTYLAVAFGLVLLVVGGDALVRGAVALARRFGVSPLLVGLTLVGFGTSTPELLTSLQAAWIGAPGIAVGNVVGSNVANILLILAVAALIRPLATSREALARDGTVVALAALACLGVVVAGTLERWAGAVLVAGLVAYVVHTYRRERVAGDASARMHAAEATAAEPGPHPVTVALGFTAGGLVLTILGARLLVTGAVEIARAAGVSDTLVGLTLVAVGTSLPELVTSIVASLRRQGDVAFGNILGSNIYNVLGILGVTALARPIPVPPEVLRLDIWIMLAATALLLFAGTGSTGARRRCSSQPTCVRRRPGGARLSAAASSALRRERALEQAVDGCRQPEPALEHGVDGVGDRKLDPVGAGEREDQRRGAPALDQADGALGVSRVAAAAECLAEAEVARVRALAGEHQVAEAGEAHQRPRLRPQRRAEPRHLGEPAGHEGGLRVVAELEAAGDAGGDGDDVLGRPAELDAHRIGRDVGAEMRGVQRRRQAGRDRAVLRCGGEVERGGPVGADLVGEARPRQHEQRPLGQHLGEAVQEQAGAGRIQPLGATRHRHTRGQPAGEHLPNFADRARRHHQEHRVAQFVRSGVGERTHGEPGDLAAGAGEDADLQAGAVGLQRQRRAPGAGADHGEATERRHRS